MSTAEHLILGDFSDDDLTAIAAVLDSGGPVALHLPGENVILPDNLVSALSAVVDSLRAGHAALIEDTAVTFTPQEAARFMHCAQHVVSAAVDAELLTEHGDGEDVWYGVEELVALRARREDVYDDLVTVVRKRLSPAVLGMHRAFSIGSEPDPEDLGPHVEAVRSGLDAVQSAARSSGLPHEVLEDLIASLVDRTQALVHQIDLLQRGGA